MGKKKILITGATGYIGSRLLKKLENSEYSICCLARKPEYLTSRVSKNIKVIKGDVLDKKSLEKALEDVDTAFYLVHSMGNTDSFEELDRLGAENFGMAAEKMGVKRIIYLGGLGDSSKKLSNHLASRHETGEVLRNSSVQVIEFRSSVVIGAGSLSFEIIRALVEKLPIMTTPKWVYIKTQPILINDLLEYLKDSVELEVKENKIFEIGSDDVTTYGDLMQIYANHRGLKRYIIPVPVLTPWLSSLWLGLVTPVYARIGRKIINSLKYQTIITDHSAKRYFKIKTKSVSDAIKIALEEEEKEFHENDWLQSMSSTNTLKSWGGKKFGSRIVDTHSIATDIRAEKLFEPIKNIGGKNGWYCYNWIWKLRGYIDVAFGGVGIRRGRTNYNEIRIGDIIDWWRVEDYKENEYLKLFAEMKLPGRAWLEFRIEKLENKNVLQQTAIFDPIGLSGIFYWYLLYPLHELIFSGMIKNIVARAKE
ncbi:MAG: DUF2867 domain-containing protein [Candidatus Dadabacteria bacterium]|nr:DUF2867 domain-containing protein [Candidatus Dadabacteria bacterium]NIQ15127.1 DUF2867 domain-containing protein [Candidatus Dadabacteria bacterium]